MSAFSKQQNHVRGWVASSWLALLLLVCWQQLHTGLSLQRCVWALIYSLPLLLPLAGLWQGRRYTHSWATLCVLPYFVVGVTEAVANGALRNWALALLGVALLWFFALLSFLRVTPVTPTQDPAG